jgi:hypothetical protein
MSVVPSRLPNWHHGFLHRRAHAEFAKHAVAALKAEDADLAADFLRQALARLGR